MKLISGPRVESMFSEMGNFLTDQRSRVKMETYNSQHMIKMHFRDDVIKKFHRPDVMCRVLGWFFRFMAREEFWGQIITGPFLGV